MVFRNVGQISPPPARNKTRTFNQGYPQPGSHLSGLTKFLDFSSIFSPFLPPANEFCEGYVFTGVYPQGGVSVGETPLARDPPLDRDPWTDTPVW